MPNQVIFFSSSRRKQKMYILVRLNQGGSGIEDTRHSSRGQRWNEEPHYKQEQEVKDCIWNADNTSSLPNTVPKTSQKVAALGTQPQPTSSWLASDRLKKQVNAPLPKGMRVPTLDHNTQYPQDRPCINSLYIWSSINGPPRTARYLTTVLDGR